LIDGDKTNHLKIEKLASKSMSIRNWDRAIELMTMTIKVIWKSIGAIGRISKKRLISFLLYNSSNAVCASSPLNLRLISCWLGFSSSRILWTSASNLVLQTPNGDWHSPRQNPIIIRTKISISAPNFVYKSRVCKQLILVPYSWPSPMFMAKFAFRFSHFPTA
jgi:hypothetical protein